MFTGDSLSHHVHLVVVVTKVKALSEELENPLNLHG